MWGNEEAQRAKRNERRRELVRERANASEASN
jgi:hypothetical protein